jgi:hypothetical protein
MAKTPALLLLLALGTGCTYARDRVLDLSDIVDLRGGFGGVGAGVKLRATEFLETGIAVGGGYKEVEWYGRRVLHSPVSDPLQLIIVGLDKGAQQEKKEPWEMNIVMFRGARPWPPPASWFRFGGEIIIPFVRGGIYLNIGELVDFVLGLTTMDIADDDGMPKASKELEHWPRKRRGPEREREEREKDGGGEGHEGHGHD